MDIQQLPAVSVADTLAAGPGIVDFWYYFYEQTADQDLLAAQEALMTPDERERHARFRFERDRRMFAATRALVRTTLSAYCPVSPAEWRFSAGKYGKPQIQSPAAPAIHFNLANTRGLVVCAVSLAHEFVGVDAETTDRRTDATKLADRFFSPSEAATLRELPASGQHQCFFTFWTLKESYIKARGLGLALALDQFSFSIDHDGVRIAFDPLLNDDAARWQFAVFDASPHHRVAVGVKTDGHALSLRATHVVPLA